MTTETTNPDEYNGWANRETWAVNLWLANDHGLYLWALDEARQAMEDAESREEAISNVASAFETWVTEILGNDEYLGEEITNNMRSDIGSLWRVDWYDVAEGWVADVIEQDEVSYDPPATIV